MNVLSLFGGTETGLVALKELGFKIDNYYSSEVDKYAMQIAKKNHPEIKHLGDIKNYESWDLPKIDMVLAGPPCQGFSIAGKGLNFKDERSQLFFTAIEILWKYKPKYFLFENVASMKKEIRKEIDELMEVDSVMINSALVSAQNRKRLYWCNWGVEQPEDKGILLKDVIDGSGYLKNHGEWKEKSDKALRIDANYHKGVDNHGQRTMVFADKSQTIPATIYKENTKSMVKRNKKGLLVGVDNENFRKLTPTECERLQTLDDGYTEGVSNTQRYKMIGNGWTVDVIKHILEQLKELKC